MVFGTQDQLGIFLVCNLNKLEMLIGDFDEWLQNNSSDIVSPKLLQKEYDKLVNNTYIPLNDLPNFLPTVNIIFSRVSQALDTLSDLHDILADSNKEKIKHLIKVEVLN